MRFAWWGKGISLIGHLMGAWGGCGWAWRLQLCRGVWLQLSGVDGGNADTTGIVIKSRATSDTIWRQPGAIVWTKLIPAGNLASSQ